MVRSRNWNLILQYCSNSCCIYFIQYDHETQHFLDWNLYIITEFNLFLSIRFYLFVFSFVNHLFYLIERIEKYFWQQLLFLHFYSFCCQETGPMKKWVEKVAALRNISKTEIRRKEGRLGGRRQGYDQMQLIKDRQIDIMDYIWLDALAMTRKHGSSDAHRSLRGTSQHILSLSLP